MLTPLSGYLKYGAYWHDMVTSTMGSSCVSATRWTIYVKLIKKNLILSFKTSRKIMGHNKLGWSVYFYTPAVCYEETGHSDEL